MLTGPLPGTETEEFDDRSLGSKHRLGSAFPLFSSGFSSGLSSGFSSGAVAEGSGDSEGSAPPTALSSLSSSPLSSPHSTPPVVAAIRQICSCAEPVTSPPMLTATIEPTTATTMPSTARYSIALCPVLVRMPRHIRSLRFTRHLVVPRPSHRGRDTRRDPNRNDGTGAHGQCPKAHPRAQSAGAHIPGPTSRGRAHEGLSAGPGRRPGRGPRGRSRERCARGRCRRRRARTGAGRRHRRTVSRRTRRSRRSARAAAGRR